MSFPAAFNSTGGPELLRLGRMAPNKPKQGSRPYKGVCQQQMAEPWSLPPCSWGCGSWEQSLLYERPGTRPPRDIWTWVGPEAPPCHWEAREAGDRISAGVEPCHLLLGRMAKVWVVGGSEHRCRGHAGRWVPSTQGQGTFSTGMGGRTQGAGLAAEGPRVGVLRCSAGQILSDHG